MAVSNDKNKVSFGLSQVHIGTFTVGDEGAVVLGTPYHVPGAVKLSFKPEGDSNTFYADNSAYYSKFSDNGFSGDLEMARFPDEFKVQFLGSVKLDDGGVAQVKGAKNPNVYIAFQTEGDIQSRRGILYNVALGGIEEEKSTTEDKMEVTTEKIGITVVGDNITGITKATYNVGDAGYETLFSAPPVPTLPSSH